MNEDVPPGGRKKDNPRDFRMGVLVTAVPIVLLSAFSTASAFTTPDLYWAWGAAAAAALLGLVVATVLALMGKAMATGMLAGVGIGALALGVTCYANLATMDFG